MITDAMYGLLIYADASINRGDLSSKDIFIREANFLKSIDNDGSYTSFEVALRSAFKQFMSTHPNSAVSHWLNEVITILLPHPNQIPKSSAVSNVIYPKFGK